MKRTENVILTNMVMVYDDAGNVLVEDRVDPGWRGVAFPGGHVEKGEPFVDAAIREVYEETGLTVWDLELCAVKDWYPEEGVRYVVFLYKTCHFCGELHSSSEGRVSWVPLAELPSMSLAGGMDVSLRLYAEREISEQFFYQVNGEWQSKIR
jgi:8-oxo-dGTP diphosphatase